MPKVKSERTKPTTVTSYNRPSSSTVSSLSSPAVCSGVVDRALELELAGKHGADVNLQHVIGIDEARRGCWVGAVVAACCILPLHVQIAGLTDSKLVKSEAQRERLYEKITTHPDVKWAVASIEADEIDRINILQATFAAMVNSVTKLDSNTRNNTSLVLIDGDKVPPNLHTLLPQAHCMSVIKGDLHCKSIAAASIIAKVTGDRLAIEYGRQYKLFRFEKNKGYGGCKVHREMLALHGPCPLHRMSYRPVREAAENLAASQIASAASSSNNNCTSSSGIISAETNETHVQV